MNRLYICYGSLIAIVFSTVSVSILFVFVIEIYAWIWTYNLYLPWVFTLKPNTKSNGIRYELSNSFNHVIFYPKWFIQFYTIWFINNIKQIYYKKIWNVLFHAIDLIDFNCAEWLFEESVRKAQNKFQKKNAIKFSSKMAKNKLICYVNQNKKTIIKCTFWNSLHQFILP